MSTILTRSEMTGLASLRGKQRSRPAPPVMLAELTSGQGQAQHGYLARE